MKKLSKIIIILITILFIIISIINIIMISYSSNYIDKDVNYDEISYVLVLGAGIRNNYPSLMLKDRLDKAIEVYNDTKAKLILSGDSIKSDEYDEVGKMKKYMLDNNIPIEDLILDEHGISTYDSIYRIKDMTKGKKIAIITQRYHLYRALYIASSLDINSYGIPAQGENYFGQEYREFREVLARNKDFVKCMIAPSSKYTDKIIYENS